MSDRILTDYSEANTVEDVNLKELFIFLDVLRDSGKTNMFGASNYLVEHYNLNRNLAREINWRYIQQTKAEKDLEEVILNG